MGTENDMEKLPTTSKGGADKAVAADNAPPGIDAGTTDAGGSVTPAAKAVDRPRLSDLWTWRNDPRWKEWADWRNDPRWKEWADWRDASSELDWEQGRTSTRGIPDVKFPRMSGSALPERRRFDIGGRALAGVVMGSGAPSVIFESALGASGLEWISIQEEVARSTCTLSYDRAGYGGSDPAPSRRSPAAVVGDLQALIHALGLPEPFVLVGHSQGGLYARLLAATQPGSVAGLVMLDPLSPDDSRFFRLPRRLRTGSGADKLGMMRTFRRLGRLRMLPMLRQWIVQGPPFFYYRGLNKATLEELWTHFVRREMHDAAIDEYVSAHDKSNLQSLRGVGARILCPTRILVHDPEIMIADIVEYGGLSTEEATQVEVLWQELLREPAGQSADGRVTIAEGSGHYIHFSRPDLVLDAIHELVAGTHKV
jgi:pimeloyl-ACP methyl ester carboxylesterase